MDFQFSEDQKMFRATLKKFVDDVVIPRAPEIDQDGVFPIGFPYKFLRLFKFIRFVNRYHCEMNARNMIGKRTNVDIFCPFRNRNFNIKWKFYFK